jgi:hypothetical protein
MKDVIEQQISDLQDFLFEVLNKYGLRLIPDDLVRVSALLLVKMLASHTTFEMMQVVGLGSVWAWTFDEIVDDPTKELPEKIRLIESYHKLANSWDLQVPKLITSDVPRTAELIVESLNLLITKFSLNDLDRSFLLDNFKFCLNGADYETRNAGGNVDVEESLLHRGYSYATPFYGAMIFVGNFHVDSLDSARYASQFLRAFGRITRIRNDLSTYEKEKSGGEINLIRVLMQSNLKESDALNLAKQYYNDAETLYKSESLGVIPRFAAVIDNFKRVHDAAYEIRDIRTLKPEGLVHI